MSSSAGSPPRPGDLTAAAAAAAEAEGIDHLDRLPDCLLLLILNRISDVKALGRCSLASRRLRALAALVDDVVVRVDCVLSDNASSPSSSSRRAFSRLARIVLGGFFKPFQSFGRILRPPSLSSGAAAALEEVSHHSPAEVLRSFKEIRRLRIQLPMAELGLDDGALLKWKAGFGSTLGTCVILGASSVSSKPSVGSFQEAGGGEEGILENSLNDILKLRVVWTISSLIAASARHYLLPEIVTDHEMLESLEMSDADGQGTLTMDRWQLQQIRARPASPSGTFQRTLLPPLKMRLWFASQVELPGGQMLNGATLVAIRPSGDWPVEGMDGGAASQNLCWVSDAFEEPYRTATKHLMKKKTYCLEMNSF